VNSFESKIWQVGKEEAVFSEDLELLADTIKDQQLVSELKKHHSELKEIAEGGIIGEISTILTLTIQNLQSNDDLIMKKCKRISDEFNSLKGALTTRVQIGFEKRNLSIQNGLAFLQVVAVLVLLFQILTYFYPFAYNAEHLLIYSVSLMVPMVIGFILYRKLQSDIMT